MSFMPPARLAFVEMLNLISRIGKPGFVRFKQVSGSHVTLFFALRHK